MATDICTKRLTKELKSLMKNPIRNPKITVAPKESNIREIHYVIEVPVEEKEQEQEKQLEKKITPAKDDTTTTTIAAIKKKTTKTNKPNPYAGGLYHGVLIFPQDYPLKPPSVKMMTENGRFQINRRLCLSMSDFHPESWNPMWSVGTILTGLYSFMIESGTTHGSIETSIRQKRKFATKSLEYNVQDPDFCKLFPQYVEMYKEQEHQKQLLRQQQQEGQSSSSSSSSNTIIIGGRRNVDSEEVDGLFTTIAGFIAVFSIILAMRFM